MKKQVMMQGIEKKNDCEHVLLKLFGFNRKGTAKSSVSEPIKIIYYIEGVCAKSEEII